MKKILENEEICKNIFKKCQKKIGNSLENLKKIQVRTNKTVFTNSDLKKGLD